MTNQNSVPSNAISAQVTRLLRLKEVSSKTGFSRSKLYEEIKAGNFPAPIKFGERMALWPENEVNAWIQDFVQRSRSEVSA